MLEANYFDVTLSGEEHEHDRATEETRIAELLPFYIKGVKSSKIFFVKNDQVIIKLSANGRQDKVD